MNSSVRRDTIVTTVGLAIIVAGFIFGVYRPVQTSCKVAEKEIQAAKQSIDEIPLRVAELNMLKTEIDQRNAFLQSNAELIPKSSDLHQVLRRVTDLAKSSRLIVTRLEPRAVVEHDSYRMTPFHVSFEGDYEGVLSFLRGMESEKRLFAIEDFSLGENRGDRSSNVEGEMHFVVYSSWADFDEYVENNSSSG